METIIFKVPFGTKAKLKKHGTMSDVLRALVDGLVNSKSESAHTKAAHLICDGPGNLSTGKDYLKQYGAKSHR